MYLSPCILDSAALGPWTPSWTHTRWEPGGGREAAGRPASALTGPVPLRRRQLCHAAPATALCLTTCFWESPPATGHCPLPGGTAVYLLAVSARPLLESVSHLGPLCELGSLVESLSEVIGGSWSKGRQSLMGTPLEPAAGPRPGKSRARWPGQGSRHRQASEQGILASRHLGISAPRYLSTSAP